MEKENKKDYFDENKGYVLLEKTRALYCILQPSLLLLPKDAKIVLRIEIEKSVIEGIKLLIKKNYKETNEEKRKLLLDYLGELNAVKMLLRQCVISKYIAYPAYEKILPLTEELLAMATAQYKNLRSQV